jgi:hypothetical protein
VAGPGDILGSAENPVLLSIDPNPPIAVTRALPALGAVSISEGDEATFVVETNRKAILLWGFVGGPTLALPGVTLAPDFDDVPHPARSVTHKLLVHAEGQVIGSWQITIADVDRPPPAPTIIIDNLAPRTADSSSFTVSQAPDPDGDAIFDHQGGWVRQRGELVIGGTIVDSADSAKGDLFKAIALARTTPYDDGDFVASEATEALVMILNSPPVIQSNGLVGAIPGTSVEFQLLASDPDGDPLTFIETEAPALGSSNLDAQSGLVTYQSAEAGDDRMTYTVEDDSGDRAAGAVVLVRSAGWAPQVIANEPHLLAMHPDVLDDPVTGFRHEDDYAEWAVPVDASQAAIDVTWAGEFPSRLFIVAPDGTLVDMSTESSLTVPQGFLGDLRVVFGLVSFELAIVPGWQLISLPIQPLNSDVAVLAGVASQVLEPVGRDSVIAETLAAGTAYWLFAQSEATQQFVGYVPDNRVLPLDRRWSTLGPIAAPPFAPVPAQEAFTPPESAVIIWRFDSAAGRFIRAGETVTPGRGYYIGTSPPSDPNSNAP